MADVCVSGVQRALEREVATCSAAAFTLATAQQASIDATRSSTISIRAVKHCRSSSASKDPKAKEHPRQSLPSLVGTSIALAVAVTVPARGSCITTIPPKRARQECDGGHAWAGPARPLRSSFFSASAPASKLLALAGPRRCSKPSTRSFQFTCTSHSHGTSCHPCATRTATYVGMGFGGQAGRGRASRRGGPKAPNEGAPPE